MYCEALIHLEVKCMTTILQRPTGGTIKYVLGRFYVIHEVI